MSIGPLRCADADDLDSIGRLADTVFMGGVSGAMQDMFPHLFNLDNLDNLFVFVDDGRVVSHVGLVRREVLVSGTPLPIAMMGAVCTYDEYRGKGLASQLVQAAFGKAKNDGADLMLISGNRTLYHRMGACPVGCNSQATLDQTILETMQTAELSLSPAVPGDLRECAEIYNRKPSRFVRPPQDWSGFLAARATMERHRSMLVIRSAGMVIGYLVLTKPQAGLAEIVEFGGKPDIVAGALNKAAKSVGATVLKITLYPDDRALKERLIGVGTAFSNVPVDGAWALLDFERLMCRLLPIIEQNTGLKSDHIFLFQERDGVCMFMVDGKPFTFSRTEAVRLVFGSPDPISAPEPLKTLFPLPSWPYGINYV